MGIRGRASPLEGEKREFASHRRMLGRLQLQSLGLLLRIVGICRDSVGFGVGIHSETHHWRVLARNTVYGLDPKETHHAQSGIVTAKFGSANDGRLNRDHRAKGNAESPDYLDRLSDIAPVYRFTVARYRKHRQCDR